jgi:phage/plasmid-like protein (TIGR03299 family)
MKVGHVIDEPVDSAQAAKLGGMEFSIELAEAGYWRDGTWHVRADRRAIVRQDTGDFYGFCSADYAPVQYADAFAFMDEINPRYVAAGTLRGGRQGFVVAKLPNHDALNMTLKGERDPHELYVVVRASHDMSKGIEVAVTTLRGKCMNMLTLPSLTAGAPQRWSVRHIGDPHAKLAEAQRTLKNTGRYERAFRDNVKRLVDVPVKTDDVPMLLKYVIHDSVLRDTKVIPEIQKLFTDSPTVGFTGTGWGLVNAVSEYYEWNRPGRRDDESRFRNNLDGTTSKYVGRTMQLVLQPR